MWLPYPSASIADAKYRDHMIRLTLAFDEGPLCGCNCIVDFLFPQLSCARLFYPAVAAIERSKDIPTVSHDLDDVLLNYKRILQQYELSVPGDTRQNLLVSRMRMLWKALSPTVAPFDRDPKFQFHLDQEIRFLPNN
jgi:hypothetical protein